uniref:Uncharacterized protein n=1 Tax=Prymnesium polylepis TaxID=72548 RepID=A0A7S4JGY6_9EUKA|mmetsp:Transcript_4620/g.10727  ORF Transcript_4620/g.10727 Transcript_4620/m.10727 type:complete len:149 (+) Transcript_4620:36-482(+)
MAPMTFFGCCCCYEALDFENIVLCCISDGETCCCTNKACLAAGEEPLGVGMVEGDKGECCVLALFCCTYGCKVPSTCCNGWGRCLCFQTAQSCPCGEDKYVKNCVCNAYGVGCAPQCGCCSAPQSEVPTTLKKGGAAAGAPTIVEIAR